MLFQAESDAPGLEASGPNKAYKKPGLIGLCGAA